MKRSMLMASLAALMVAAVPRGQAASDYLLEIEGIKGESSDSRRPGAIEVASFSWGVSNAPALGGGGTGAGKANFQDISFVCRLDKATPLLFKACATGQVLQKVELFVQKPGAEKTDYYVVTLQDCLISSIQQSGEAGGEAITQRMSFTYQKIEWTYTAADGSLHKAGYDLKAAKAL